MANNNSPHIESNSVGSDREQQIRALAERKGLILRRAVEGEDRWHLMTPKISSELYAVSLGNPHSYTLEEARRLLSQRPDR